MFRWLALSYGLFRVQCAAGEMVEASGSIYARVVVSGVVIEVIVGVAFWGKYLQGLLSCSVGWLWWVLGPFKSFSTFPLFCSWVPNTLI